LIDCDGGVVPHHPAPLAQARRGLRAATERNQPNRWRALAGVCLIAASCTARATPAETITCIDDRMQVEVVATRLETVLARLAQACHFTWRGEVAADARITAHLSSRPSVRGLAALLRGYSYVYRPARAGRGGQLALIGRYLDTEHTARPTPVADDSFARASALADVDDFEDRTARGQILMAWNDQAIDVREAALMALSFEARDLDPTLLVPALGDREPHIRSAAIDILASVPGAAARRLLVQATGDLDAHVRAAAHAALAMRPAMSP